MQKLKIWSWELQPVLYLNTQKSSHPSWKEKTSEEQVAQHSGELAHEPELDIGDNEEDDGHNYHGHMVLP